MGRVGRGDAVGLAETRMRDSSQMGMVSDLGTGPTFGAMGGLLRTMRATSGDYSAVEHFLCAQLCQIPTVDFQDQLEMPDGNTRQRLLLKQDERIVGHVHLRFREVSWGKARLLTCRFGALDLLPEYRSPLVITTLLREIEYLARERRAVLVQADLADVSQRGSFPAWPSNWLTTSGFEHFEANPRALLAEISIREAAASTFHQLEYSKSCKATRIRPFRQIELTALMKIYRSHESTGFGFLKRTEGYWQWLVRRSTGAQILVAVDHRQSRGIKQRGGKIVAYAVSVGNEILEILAEPENVIATEQLLSRICADGMEQNFRSLCLPIADRSNRLTELYAATSATNKVQKNRIQRAGIACVPSAKLLVRRLSPELIRRWRMTQSADVEVLGWGLGERACHLLFTEKGVRLVNGDAGPDRLICAQQIWIRLLIGELNAPTAFAANLLEASTPRARSLAEILFPELPVWRTAWDNFINI